MPQYTVRDPETGRTITFNWAGDQPPTDADIAEVFAAAPPAPEPKSLGGFLSNVGSDLKSVPQSAWNAAQMVSRYNPMTLTGMQNTIGNVSAALKGQVPDDPAAQAGVAFAQNPGAPFRAAGDKLAHPFRTAGELVDRAYDKPVTTAMDASALMAGGAGALRLAGRAPRVAAGLANASRVTDPVNLAGQGVGGLMKTTGSGSEAAGEAMMRKALNMSDADVRARGGAERTALEHRIPATAEGDAKLSGLMAPIGQRQQAAIDAMPDFLVSHDQLPRLNTLIDDTARIKGSDPARYDAAIQQRREALTDPNFTSPVPVFDLPRPRSPLQQGVEYVFHGTNQPLNTLDTGSYFAGNADEAAMWAQTRARQRGGEPRVYAVPRADVQGRAMETLPENAFRSGVPHTGIDATQHVLAPNIVAVEGRYPAPVPGQLLHENKQALQQRAAQAKAYIANPNPKAESDAIAARAGDYRQLLNDASPEYAAANAEFEPLMNLQEQLRERALHRGGHEVPYAVGFGLQAARGNVISPVAGMLSGLALRNPRLASGLAQGAFDFGQAAGAAGRATQMVAPGINRLDALQRAILRQRASDNGR